MNDYLHLLIEVENALYLVNLLTLLF